MANRPPGRRLVPMALAVLALVALAAGCRQSRPAQSTAPAPGPVVVASFNFSESRLLGEIYASALERAGVPVRRELDLGPRELVLPALRQGLVDVLPEYLGSALAAVNGDEPATVDADAALGRLRSALQRWKMRALTPAAGQDQNGFAITRATADRLHASKLSDLAAAGPLVVGGPAECPSRPYCLLGLQQRYGLQISRFVPIDQEDQRATALQEAVVDLAVMFTTDGRLATGDLVLLDDDRGLQPPENVVPVVSDRVLSRYGDRVQATLDAVSARLTTEALVFLNWRVELGGRNVADEAHGWLVRQGLVPGPGQRASTHGPKAA